MTQKLAISTMHPDAYFMLEQGSLYFRRHAFAHILEDTGEIAIKFRRRLYPVIGDNDDGDEVFVVTERTLAREKDDGRPIRRQDLRTTLEIAALRRRSKLSKSMGAHLKEVLF